MLFIDQTEIFITSGRGGTGLVSFKSAKFQPKAGADGGDGGNGGDVYLVGNRNLNTLSHLRHRTEYKATDGAKGGTSLKTGRSGEDLYIDVPLGTMFQCEPKEGESFEAVPEVCTRGEVLRQGQKVLVAKGGKRGLGNARFLTSTHQAPDESTKGGARQCFHVNFSLKLLADVGLAGLPNAGKSTLLSTISSARPKIADYPFTTLTPQLGVVEDPARNFTDDRSFVVADIPGLIPGAAQGKGLGLDFLRHLERTSIVLYVLDPFTSEYDVFAQYEILRNEIREYSEQLFSKPPMVAVSKMDLADESFDYESVRDYFSLRSVPIMFFSSATKTGITSMLHTLREELFKPKSDDNDIGDEQFKPLMGRPKLSDFKIIATKSKANLQAHL